MKINQFHSGTAVGDAITNQMLMIKDLLVKEGYESEIYADFIPGSLHDKIKSINNYKGSKENLLIVHHSMGFDGFDKIISLPDKKAMIYHNITPEKYFTDEHTRSYIRKGLRQASEYKKHMNYIIADSNYNRKELISMGHKNIDVMPVQISLNRFDIIKSDKEFIKKFSGSKNFLFVGRLVSNKCQDDVIKSFALYNKSFEVNSNLLLVGDLGGAYIEYLKKVCIELDIEDRVYFLGKISEEHLKACYEIADLFLCMSEHEGFGVPLLEAMVMSVPVIAFSSSAISETMGGKGILVLNKDYSEIASLAHEVITDKDLQSKIIQMQKKRIEKLKSTDTKKILLQAIENLVSSKRTRTIQIQGPFESSYSLAIVNRKLSESLDKLEKDNISIYCTEGPGDYKPKEADLKDKPHAKALWEKAKEVIFPDVTIRNMYPPRVADVNGGLNFQLFGWEEDRVPERYVRDFNRYLNGIGSMSEFVTRSLMNSGTQIPVKTIGIGVELVENYEQLNPYHLKSKKRTKFLHISSAFPRKGVDILIEAYYASFTSESDVCLVLKTFPNPHNNINEIINNLNSKFENPPEIEWINEDLSTEDLNRLYKAADCYVHVARGEGFGLPVAEAMLAKIPVIVSPNTGLADFCNKKTALIVDYSMEKANSHLSSHESMWAKPNRETLVYLLKQFIYEKEKLGINEKVEAAYQNISTYYTWKAVANRWHDFITEIEEQQHKPKVAMITSWNNKCGIAEYSRFHYESIRNYTDITVFPSYGVELLKSDEYFVGRRLWHSAFEGNLLDLKDELGKIDSDILHFQFNFGFFNIDQFADLIEEFHDKKSIIVTFHKTKDSDVAGKRVSLGTIKNSLNKCFKLVVHQQDDVIQLVNLGIEPSIIAIIPLGQMKYPTLEKKHVQSQLEIKRSLVLGSYGFLLPHKGIFENLQALKIIKGKYPDVLYIICCARHDSSESDLYLKKCQEFVAVNKLEENVVFVTDFLPLSESMVLLQACDFLMMTYLPSEESASGAVRFCIAAQRPTITTKQKIFGEFSDCTFQIQENKPDLLVDAIYHLMDVDNQEMISQMQEHSEKTSWAFVSKKYNELYRSAEY